MERLDLELSGATSGQARRVRPSDRVAGEALSVGEGETTGVGPSRCSPIQGSDEDDSIKVSDDVLARDYSAR